MGGYIRKEIMGKKCRIYEKQVCVYCGDATQCFFTVCPVAFGEELAIGQDLNAGCLWHEYIEHAPERAFVGEESRR